jgi:hypothetical protein
MFIHTHAYAKIHGRTTEAETMCAFAVTLDAKKGVQNPEHALAVSDTGQYFGQFTGQMTATKYIVNHLAMRMYTYIEKFSFLAPLNTKFSVSMV